MFKANSLSHIHGTLLKRTDKGAGPGESGKKTFKIEAQCILKIQKGSVLNLMLRSALLI